MKKLSYAPILLAAFMVFPLTACGKKVTVVWKNDDGTVLETDEIKKKGTIPTYDGATPTKAATAEYTYTFKGWDAEIVPTGKENVVYTATYTATKNKYDVTWKNEDGTVLSTSKYEYGQTPSYTGETPTKEGNAQYSYSFKEWDKEASAVTANQEYVATYNQSVNTYTVTWKNEDGTVLKTDTEVPYGTVPEYTGATPEKAAPRSKRLDDNRISSDMRTGNWRIRVSSDVIQLPTIDS